VPEIQLKRILVPVDFSACSTKALQYAAVFAKQFGAEILLLHVVQPPVYMEGTAVAVAPISEESAREAASMELAQLRGKEVPKLDTKTSVRIGKPYLEIIRAADEMNADFIVIGTHGRSGLARMFLGSTSERVVRHAPCPVMVVREREHDFVRTLEAAGASISQ
jgi:nucleotide-binding universal stress UspA family protein